MKEREFVSVFRSSKKNDTYLFVRRGQNWEDLPESLRGIFGQPVHSMDLVLTPDRKLEEQESYVVDFKRKLEQRNP